MRVERVSSASRVRASRARASRARASRARASRARASRARASRARASRARASRARASVNLWVDSTVLYKKQCHIEFKVISDLFPWKLPWVKEFPAI